MVLIWDKGSSGQGPSGLGLVPSGPANHEGLGAHSQGLGGMLFTWLGKGLFLTNLRIARPCHVSSLIWDQEDLLYVFPGLGLGRSIVCFP